MNGSDDPPRLSELSDAPSGLTDLLDEAKSDQLSDDRIEALAAFFDGLPPGGSEAPPPEAQGRPPTATTQAPTAGLRVGVKLGMAAFAVGVVGIGGWFISRRVPAPQPSDTAATSSALAPSASVQAASEESATAASTAEPTAPIPSATTSSTPGAPVGSKRRAPATTPAPNPVEEHRLLRSARAALVTDPARAKALTDEHRRRFPRGVLTQEREVIAIEAVRKLGNAKAARSKADAFTKRYPKSPHTKNLEHAKKNP